MTKDTLQGGPFTRNLTIDTLTAARGLVKERA